MTALGLKTEKDSRRIFIETLLELAEADEKIVFIVNDVGFNYVNLFQEKFPNRFFNFGVTEASTVLIAAAMALDGWRPYVYSMCNFVAFRPFEMVRNGVALHNANVKLVGVSGSKAYKFLGFSHNQVFENEDAYHLQPYMKCYISENDAELKKYLQVSYDIQEPSYIRL